MIDYSLTPGRKLKENAKLINIENPVISIITPFYNGGETLMETANCVFSQTYPYFEWIIVDDGSTDKKSIKQLDKVKQLDKRVKIFHKNNEGPSVARDYGISKACKFSKYVFFLDCDDMIENNMIECLYWTLQTHSNASFAYTAATVFGDSNHIWERYLTTKIEKKENVINISSMVNKLDLIEVGCFDIKEKGMYEDWNLWLKLLSVGKIPIRINAPLFWYRSSNAGEFSRANMNHDKAMNVINKTASNLKNNVQVIQFPRCNKDLNSSLNNDTILPYYKRGIKKTILFIISSMSNSNEDLFNINLIKDLNKNKYNIIVLTTTPKDNDLRQEFYENSDECYDMSTFLDRKDYIIFTDYIIKSRNVDYIYIGDDCCAKAILSHLESKNINICIINNDKINNGEIIEDSLKTLNVKSSDTYETYLNDSYNQFKSYCKHYNEKYRVRFKDMLKQVIYKIKKFIKLIYEKYICKNNN